MKKIIVMCLLCFSCISLNTFAVSPLVKLFVSPRTLNCPTAQPTVDPNFCPSFKSVAACHCTSSGLPGPLCQDMNQLYDRMVSMFGSQLKACEYQKDTSTQTCMDDWNCYRLGGRDSAGNLCSSTGRACQ